MSRTNTKLRVCVNEKGNVNSMREFKSRIVTNQPDQTPIDTIINEQQQQHNNKKRKRESIKPINSLRLLVTCKILPKIKKKNKHNRIRLNIKKKNFAIEVWLIQ